MGVQLIAVAALVATITTVLLAAISQKRQAIQLAVVVSVVVLGVLHAAGAPWKAALQAATPVTLVLAYAGVAAVSTYTGLIHKVAQLMKSHPVAILVAAATMSVLLSNDVVIVLLAPAVLVSQNRTIAAPALFVGANVTGGLLPQGSPTNQILFGSQMLSGEVGFFDYLSVSVVPTAAMLAVAVAVFAFGNRFTNHKLEASLDESTWLRARKMLAGLDRPQQYALVLAVVAVAIQPVFALFSLSQLWLTVVVFSAVVVVAVVLGIPLLSVVTQIPWQVLGVVVVLSASVGLLGGFFASGMPDVAWAASLFVFAAAGTDILAATLAEPAVTHAARPVALALVAVTAGAFASPVGSVSAILLLAAHRESGIPVRARTFVVATSTAVVCFTAGVIAVLVAS